MNRKQRRAMKKQGLTQTGTISICPDHGRYDKSCLCPCYDPGGPLAHLRDEYGTEEWMARMTWKPTTNDSGEEIGFCPIHGETAVSDIGIFQCGCFDEDGNKIVHLSDNPNEAEEH